MNDKERRILEVEAEIRKTPYNKRTQHAIGLLKAKLARLREKQESRSSSIKKGEGYSVKRTGESTVILVGLPSTGKSTILNKLTNAESRIGAYEFTTLTVVPGIMEYNHAKIQILDIPGIVLGASSGKGRGKEILSCVRAADLCIIIVDVNNPKQEGIVKKELFNAGIRLNQNRPDVKINKKESGGINILSSVKLSLDKRTIKDILSEFKIVNADILFRQNINIDQLIDIIKDNRKYIPAITIFNKIDTLPEDKLNTLKKRFPEALFISAEKEKNLDFLKKRIYDSLGLISIYLKEPGKKPDLNEPLILKKNMRVRDACKKIHRDFENRFRYACIWGKSAKFPGQKVSLKHKLKNNDILEIHLR